MEKEIDIIQQIKLGEVSKVQFKERLLDNYDIGCELVAFSNARGGMLVVGVKDKTGSVNPLSYLEVQETTSTLGNIASENVVPTILIEVETVSVDGGSLVVAHIKEGVNKPYHDNRGIVWVKNGADKRKVFDNAELAEMMTDCGSFSPDEAGVRDAAIKDLDESTIKTFLGNEFVITINRPESNQPNADSDTDLDTDSDTFNADSDTIRPKITNKQRDIVNFCSVPRSSKEILERVGVTYHSKNIQTYIMSLIEAGYLEMTNPEHPNASNQKYRRSKIYTTLHVAP